jgi:hypothetical protein
MRIELTKGPTSDRIDIRRSDGSTACTSFPHKGPVPHDVVHFFVELELGIQMGFWGLVAHGHDPEEIAAMAKVAGHASAKRRREPDPSFVPAIQAERIVECFEADLWAPGSDAATFREAAFTACDQSLVPRVAIEPEKISRIRHQLAAFRRRWEVLPFGSSCTLEWPENPR